MLQNIKRLVERAAVWFLRSERRPLDLQALTGTYLDGVSELTAGLDKVLTDFHRAAIQKKAARHEAAGVPKELAYNVASADILISGCDIVRLSVQTGESVLRVAEVYFAVGHAFSLDWLQACRRVTMESYWQKRAISVIAEDLFGYQFHLAENVLAERGNDKGKKEAASDLIQKWQTSRSDASARMNRLLASLKADDNIDLSMLAVANGQFRSLLAH